MSCTPFDQEHDQLDSQIVGVMAVDPETDFIHGLDGSIVIWPGHTEMIRWLEHHEIPEPHGIEPAYYDAIVGSLSEEGISYHLEGEVAARLLSLLAKDQRFRPEVLQYTDDTGTLITSSFNPSEDNLLLLRREMDEYVVGHLAPTATTVFGDVSAAHGPMTPLTYGDFVKLSISPTDLDSYAHARLESVLFWARFIEDCED